MCEAKHSNTNDTVDSSRRRTAAWPYPRYARFRETVKKAATDWFASHGHDRNPKYPYILADWSDWPKNVILPEVAAFISRTADAQRARGHTFPLHEWVHNGLSSQALLFNLVGPLLLSGDLSPLQRVLQTKGIPVPTGQVEALLEFEDRDVFGENSAQPTSIDLALIPSPSGPPVFIECKFVEREFGGCSIFAGGDCDGRSPAGDLDLCFLHHIGRKYWTIAKKHGLVAGPILSDKFCVFASHYQFFRELLFALEKDGIFVLLSDERSSVFHRNGPQGPRGLMPVLRDLLPEPIRQRVVQVSIQELLKEIDLSGAHGWVGEFRRKYGMEECNSMSVQDRPQ